jgi:Na+/proline symporter
MATNLFGKISGIICGIMATLLSWLHYCAKGKKFALGVMAAGIAITLLALFSKVSDTNRQKKP